MRLGLVTVLVEDYGEAIGFFCDVLGFELAEDAPARTEDGREKRWVVVRPPDGETGLLLARADGEQQRAVIGRQAAGRVAFFLDVEDFWVTYRRLADAGVEFVRPPRRQPHGMVAVFLDVAGNRWDLRGPAPAVSLRQAGPEDAVALARIAQAAYARYLQRIGRPPAPMLADYAAEIARGGVWAAELDGEVAGFVVLREEDGRLLIENVAVDPEHQGQGIGGGLLAHAEDVAGQLGVAEVCLFTNEAMTENLAWYAALGYQETARRTEDGYRRVYLAKPVAE